MRFGFAIVFCIALVHVGLGQYTYFNTVDGVEGDDASEGVTNCEFLDNSFYVWGGGIIDGSQHKLLREYDVETAMLNENWLVFSDNYIYSGTTNSFQRIPDEDAFLVSHSLLDANGTHGFLMKVDENLDTIWMRIIDIYPDETYIYTHAWDGDGFILAGEHQVAGVGQGTFIAKVDTEGQYLWHTVLHEPAEGSYRNRYISVAEDGYILSGSEGGGLDTEGIVEYYDTISDEQLTLSTSNPAITRGIMEHLVTTDGTVLVTQSSLVEDYPGSSNPALAYCRQRVYQLDFDLEELVLLGEYFQDNELITGGVVKTMEGSANHLVMVGQGNTEVDGELREISFAMAVGANFEVDWYTELSYEMCSGCTNELYDIEQAPDGGYVMVGKFNSPEDPYDKTWLVKVDACGDLVWQGCEAVGIDEWDTSSSVSVFPNPTSDFLNIEISKENEVESIEILDLSGRVVLNRLFINNMDVSSLNSGIYLLKLSSDDGEVHAEKLIIE